MNKAFVYYFFSYLTVSFVIAILLVPLMRQLSFRLGAVDRGTGRRVHRGIVPRLGGIAIFLAFVTPLCFALTRGNWGSLGDKTVGILVASTVVLLVGVYDDTKGARIRNKLIGEILAAALIFAWGVRIDIVSNPFGGAITLDWLSLPVTILWIIVVTNAINLIDGLDGLAAGTGILISATFFILAGSDFHLQLIYVILAGSLLGFLRYNFPPASVFMGDSGSLFLGFLLAVTSILSSHKATALVAIMVPIVAFGLPLMDMFYAVIRRHYRGLPLGNADKEHIHHKLLGMGLSKKKVLFILYAFNLGLMLLVLILVRRQVNIEFFVLTLLAAVVIIGLRMLGYIEFLPFFKDTIKNYDMGRKRKYYNYVIKRFRKNASVSKSFDDLTRHLDELMKEYNFGSVEIFLNSASNKTPFYRFNSGEAQIYPVTLSFPVVADHDRCVGDIHVSKNMNGDCLLCTDGMIRALSEEISRFIKNNSEQNESPSKNR
jgi:UDP-GlcNAc:undecaprenyl-phosphate GlcNAc-1-phosphate transferase